MVCGCPTVTSNVTSLPEVVGDGTLLYDPYNVVDIAGAIKTLLDNEEIRSDIIQKGIQKANSYTWDKVGEATWTTYERVLKAYNK